MGTCGQLLNLSRVMAKNYRTLLDEISTDFSLTSAELSLLLYMMNEEENKACQIAEGLGMSKASVSKAVDSLMQRGFLEGKADESDHRIIRLSIAEKACPILKKASSRHDELVEQVFHGITDEEKEMLASLTKKLSDNLCSGCQG